MDCAKYFGARKGSTVFGKRIVNIEGNTAIDYSFTVDTVATVYGNKKKFTRQDVDKAHSFRRFQHIAGHASDKMLTSALTKRSMNGCPYTTQHARIANKILGNCIYGIKKSKPIRHHCQGNARQRNRTRWTSQQ